VPLYVQTTRGEITGPWPERQLDNIRAYARIGSKNSDNARRIIVIKGRSVRTLAVYENGERTWPLETADVAASELGAADGGDQVGPSPLTDFAGLVAGGMLGFAVGGEISKRVENKGIPVVGAVEQGLTYRLAGAGLGAFGGLYASRALLKAD
jgi:hypothetical protein